MARGGGWAVPGRVPARARVAAGALALLAWAGLVLALRFEVGTHGGSAAAGLWAMAAYFTNLANLLIAVVFSAVALGRASFAAPRTIAGAMLAIGLVGVVYWLVLYDWNRRPAVDASGWLEHVATPALTPVFWLLFTPKGALRPRDALRWTAFPLAYFAYALVRGLFSHRYPYGFMDVNRIGYAHAVLNAGLIALGFIAVGLLLTALDGRLGGGRRRGRRR